MPTPEEEAAAAAAKAAADAATAAAAKAAADKAAADKAAADKAAADAAAAEAARIAASKLSDTEAALLKENMANKQKLKDSAAAQEALQAQLKAFEGIDPAKAKELLAAQAKAATDAAAAEEKRLRDAGEFDRIKASMTEQQKAEIAAREKTIKEKSTALDTALKTINDLTVGASFTSSQFITTELVLTPRVARDVYGSHFDVENGQIVAYDKPKGAENRTKMVDSSGDPIGFEAAIKKLVEAAPDKDQLLKSKLKIGASSTTTSASSFVPSHQTVGKELTGMARIKASLDKGALKKAK